MKANDVQERKVFYLLHLKSIRNCANSPFKKYVLAPNEKRARKRHIRIQYARDMVRRVSKREWDVNRRQVFCTIHDVVQ